jgi:hypothetical protein
MGVGRALKCNLQLLLRVSPPPNHVWLAKLVPKSLRIQLWIEGLEAHLVYRHHIASLYV